MKTHFFGILTVALGVLVGCQQAPQQEEAPVVEVTDYGVKGDGQTLNTEAFNKAIQEAPEGAVIHIPAGKYLTGTIHLKSHITLQLDTLAEIIGTTDLEAYDYYRPTKDMTRYDTGAGTANANLSGDERWTKALILGQNLEDVTIRGKGLLNGQHVVDSLGKSPCEGLTAS
jgi:polygalacturonase